MRNGTSSAVDQSGIPIYRGTQPRRGSHPEITSHVSANQDQDDVYYDQANENLSSKKIHHGLDDDSERVTKPRIRRGQAWYQSRDLQVSTALTLLALVVRLWAIGFPDSVVFDEVHFGGFASKYIQGGFFMDVHPPLAKILIALVGWLSGLNPSFKFANIGDDYIGPNVPYVPMRLLGALMGVAVVPISFFTVKNSGHSIHAAVLVALLVTFGNIVTQSRLILLDSPLILFTAFTALAWTNFHNQRHNAFSGRWFGWLFLTGVGLGLSLSCKWVGLFIVATIGCSTLKQLWDIWGDLRITPKTWLNHFIARAVFLIGVPIAIYMLMFEIHFLLLSKSGEGDGFMSAPFQMTLGHSLKDSPLRVAYGARVTIRHEGTNGGYLHSHPSTYETGSKQQQITLYSHKDNNNDWIIQKRDGSVPDGLEYVSHGDIIRLLHVGTVKRLHSHDKKAPVTEDENHFEVSGYGYAGHPGDANDEWRLEIVSHDSYDPEGATSLHTLRSKFKLVHTNMHCDLFSHSVKLPKWGFEQQEVTCMRSAVVNKVTWTIESNEHVDYPEDAVMVNYKPPGFLSKFIELNQVMWSTNAGLTSSHPYDSRPSAWPLLRRGISFWGKNEKHIYLIGNWFTWFLSTASIAIYAIIRGLLMVRDKRGYSDTFLGLREYYELSGGFFFMGWIFHYFPFFLMDRQLFLHHYLPALYFSILLLGVTIDVGFRFIPSRARILAVIIIGSAAIYIFSVLSPLAYGLEWTRTDCEAAKQRKTWDFDCQQYPTDYAAYKKKAASAATWSSDAAAIESNLHDLTKKLLNKQDNEADNSVDNDGGADPAQAVQGVDQHGQDTGDAFSAGAADDQQVTDPASAVENFPRDEDDEEVEPDFDFEIGEDEDGEADGEADGESNDEESDE
ncbi:hypothetical protein BGZ94_002415 [Podila epigama]|nr:hypothetical protein BGZ94_002415 [Podila epigama]